MQVTGFEGKGLVNTFLGGDRPTGKLTSPEFTIERDYIKFLIGGGGHKGKTCMNLLVRRRSRPHRHGPQHPTGRQRVPQLGKLGRQEIQGQESRPPDRRRRVRRLGPRQRRSNLAKQHASEEETLRRAAKTRGGGTPHPENAQEIKITGKYIIFPVSNKGQRGRMTIVVGDQLVHNLDCDFPPNKDAIDWWTYLDMSEYVGKTAKVVANAAPEICEMFESSDEIRHLQPLYDEALRPQFHMSQMRGWNNDPNGMCYYDGQYHFFWQCNPAGRNWANMYWGHATSPDMVHWTEHDRALALLRRRCREPSSEDGRQELLLRAAGTSI